MKNQKEKLRKQSHSPVQQKEYLGINLPKETKDSVQAGAIKTVRKTILFLMVEFRQGSYSY